MTTPAPFATDVPHARHFKRRLPVGAEVVAPGETHFRLWAPRRQQVEVVLDGDEGAAFALAREEQGYFAALIPVGAGARFRYRLDGQPDLYQCPASRFQPEGPFGPSEVVDPSTFSWTDSEWPGVHPQGRVVYEMHVGTFTPKGTWRAAVEQLPRLADVGINLLEVMPVADFPGQFGWGYDGVNLFAPTRLYGHPDDFRAFIDRAHALGIGVILDVVYNHVGPSGSFMKAVSPAFFSDKHKTDWGEGINFDGPENGPVRAFYLGNVTCWISEYHLDGLRLDATQDIHDDSPGEHILAAISRTARAAANRRSVVLIAENEPQHTKLVRDPKKGGFGLDMLWNDDFHHTARVALTGRSEAYYSDYHGRPQELISAVKHGYLYQGQHYTWQKKGRGTPAFDLPPWAFVTFLDNHDQVANSGAGLRTHALTSPGGFRAMTALMLLAPGTPMLFQGQEFASSSPFFFFADHKGDLATMVRAGRLKFLTQFPSLADEAGRPAIPEPHDPATFVRCKLDLAEIEKNRWAVDLHRDLLHLRREDPTFRRQDRRGLDGAVLAAEVLVLRFFGEAPELDRLLLVNLGSDLNLAPMPEPLLAAPEEHAWQVRWSSDDPRYGGCGVGKLECNGPWTLPGHSALVLFPEREEGEKSS